MVGSRGKESQIKFLASKQFAVSGDVHQIVTFLNRILKDDNLIFGLSTSAEGIYRLSIYRVQDGSGMCSEDQRT